MTPAECAELQSLGDIHLPTSDLEAYKALGNAVNARVVKAIAERLLEGLGNPDSSSTADPEPLRAKRTSASKRTDAGEECAPRTKPLSTEPVLVARRSA